MNRWKYGVAALGVMGTTFFSPVAQAAAYIDIDLNGSFLFEGEMPITNIAIANPEVADIVRPSGFDSQVLIVMDATSEEESTSTFLGGCISARAAFVTGM